MAFTTCHRSLAQEPPRHKYAVVQNLASGRVQHGALQWVSSVTWVGQRLDLGMTTTTTTDPILTSDTVTMGFLRKATTGACVVGEAAGVGALGEESMVAASWSRVWSIPA